jgi:hypothetical protein
MRDVFDKAVDPFFPHKGGPVTIGCCDYGEVAKNRDIQASLRIRDFFE